MQDLLINVARERGCGVGWLFKPGVQRGSPRRPQVRDQNEVRTDLGAPHHPLIPALSPPGGEPLSRLLRDCGNVSSQPLISVLFHSFPLPVLFCFFSFVPTVSKFKSFLEK